VRFRTRRLLSKIFLAGQFLVLASVLSAGQEKTALTRLVELPRQGSPLFLEGDIKHGTNHVYSFNGQKGQHLALQLKASGDLVFKIQTPNALITKDSVDHWEGNLPESGLFTIEIRYRSPVGSETTRAHYNLVVFSGRSSPNETRTTLTRQVEVHNDWQRPEIKEFIEPGTSHMYGFTGRAGQTLDLQMKVAGNARASIYAPSGGSTLEGANMIYHWHGELPADGKYTITVTAPAAVGGPHSRPRRIRYSLSLRVS